MKLYGGAEIQLHTFLTSAVWGGKWTTSRPNWCFVTRERPVGSHLLADWLGPRNRMGPRTCLYASEKIEFSFFFIRNSNKMALFLTLLCYFVSNALHVSDTSRVKNSAILLEFLIKYWSMMHGTMNIKKNRILLSLPDIDTRFLWLVPLPSHYNDSWSRCHQSLIVLTLACPVQANRPVPLFQIHLSIRPRLTLEMSEFVWVSACRPTEGTPAGDSSFRVIAFHLFL
jgi:hypothetical protein